MQQSGGQISPDGYWMWNGVQWVPNPYRPVAAPPLTPAYESAAYRARIASILIAINIASLLVVTVLDLAVPSTNESNDVGGLILALALVLSATTFFGTFVAAVVFFCMWLHRVVRNMPALGSPDPRWSPAGAVGRCFIPFLNLVHPLRSVLDAWRGSESSRRWMDLPARRSIAAPAAMVWWWILWLGGDIGNIRFNGSVPAAFEILGSAATIGAGLLVIRLMRQLTARQEHKNQLLMSGQLV